MKRFIIAAVVVSLVATFAVAISSSKASAGPPGDPFRGVWTATDNVDDSNLTLRITPGLAVVLSDDRATGCPGAVPAIFTGSGTVSDTTVLDIDGVVKCLRVGVLPPFSFTLTFDPHGAGPGDDHLHQADGTTFNRI